ncbi:MAG: tyrosine-type recombinase/integrase [Firmicutes bacterium]|nr:tyrosine-type recombinase/integrase [Bacillota bacterium]
MEAEVCKFERVFEVVFSSRFWKPFCKVLINTSMDINNLLNLKWSDVDLDEKLIKVNHKAFMLSDETVGALVNHYAFRQREQKRVRGKVSFIAYDDLVFGNEQGAVRSYKGLSHNFRKFLHRYGIQGVTLNCLKWLNHKTQRIKNKIKYNEQEYIEM